MSELPEGWASARLGELITLKYGKSLPAAKRDGLGFPVYGSNGIVGQHSEPLTATSTIIVGRKGSFGEVHLSDGPCSPIDTTYYVDEFDATDERFTYHLLSHLPLTEMNRSSAIPGLNREDAYSLDVALPPHREQRRIVEKVESLTVRTARARKELDRIPTLIACYKQRLLALAFSGQLTAGWRESQGLKPEWSELPLGELVQNIVAGKNLRCEERPPLKNERGVVKVSAVTWGEFDPAEAKTLPASFEPPEKTRISNGDFLISRANTLELVAAVVIVEDAPPNLFLSDKILRLELPDPEKPWLLWFLRSPQGRAAIEARATGNQLSMRNLSQKNLLGIEMPRPSEPERKEIVRRIEAAFGWLDRLANEYAAAEKLLPKLEGAILAKAFRGQLVPQDPNDEPASALLKRISEDRASYKSVKTSSKRNRKTRTQTPRKAKVTMTKSRHDEDVWQKPYLTGLLKQSKSATSPEELFSRSDLQLVDFYHQLSTEYEKGWLVEVDGQVKAA